METVKPVETKTPKWNLDRIDFNRVKIISAYDIEELINAVETKRNADESVKCPACHEWTEPFNSCCGVTEDEFNDEIVIMEEFGESTLQLEDYISRNTIELKAFHHRCGFSMEEIKKYKKQIKELSALNPAEGSMDGARLSWARTVINEFKKYLEE